MENGRAIVIGYPGCGAQRLVKRPHLSSDIACHIAGTPIPARFPLIKLASLFEDGLQRPWIVFRNPSRNHPTPINQLFLRIITAREDERINGQYPHLPDLPHDRSPTAIRKLLPCGIQEIPVARLEQSGTALYQEAHINGYDRFTLNEGKFRDLVSDVFAGGIVKREGDQWMALRWLRHGESSWKDTIVDHRPHFSSQRWVIH